MSSFLGSRGAAVLSLRLGYSNLYFCQYCTCPSAKGDTHGAFCLPIENYHFSPFINFVFGTSLHVHRTIVPQEVHEASGKNIVVIGCFTPLYPLLTAMHNQLPEKKSKQVRLPHSVNGPL